MLCTQICVSWQSDINLSKRGQNNANAWQRLHRVLKTSDSDLTARQASVADLVGGLAVDYEGSGTDSAASLNYSMQSYANDIVAALQVHMRGAASFHPRQQ